jgi:3-hydroxyacyl-CoA dehydrogenase
MQAVVIGAGYMGSGIAQVLLEKSIPVFLKDVSQDHIGRATQNIRGKFIEAVKKSMEDSLK